MTSLFFQLGVPPDIDEGPLVPQPPSIPSVDMKVKIGTPVYVVDGYNVTIDCNITLGTPPVTISWFHNGQPDLSRANFSTIIVTDAKDDDVFACRADNNIGFDVKNTTIKVFDKSNKTSNLILL